MALKINIDLSSFLLIVMKIIKSSGFWVCLSAFLLVLGSYLVTVEVPIQITYDHAAAEQYDLMRVYLPFGLTLWILALMFLVYGVVLRARKPLAVAQVKKQFLMASITLGVALGFLALFSTFLPWVNVKRTEPLIETRDGTFNVEQYHALTGINLLTGVNNMAGDIILLVVVGAVIGILYIPLLSLLESREADTMRALLFFLSGMCTIISVISVYAHRIWWISLRVNGALGFSATFESPGAGFLIATLCATGLIAFSIITATRGTR